MACLAMHMSCAYQYLKHNSSEETEDFIKGTIAPDLSNNKLLSHFGCEEEAKTVKQMLTYKIDIVKAAKNIKLNCSYNKAYFLHLLCDDLFYNFIYSPNFEEIGIDKIKQYLYNDYDTTTFYLINKYKINLPKEVCAIAKMREGESKILPHKVADLFINHISKINLLDAHNQIIKNVEDFRHKFLSQLKQNI